MVKRFFIELSFVALDVFALWDVPVRRRLAELASAVRTPDVV